MPKDVDPAHRVEMYEPNFDTGGHLVIPQGANQVVIHNPGQFPELAHAYLQHENSEGPNNLMEWVYQRTLLANSFPSKLGLFRQLDSSAQQALEDMEMLRAVNPSALKETVINLLANEVLVRIGELMVRGGLEAQLQSFTKDRWAAYRLDPLQQFT